jgi:hypothetical protein
MVVSVIIKCIPLYINIVLIFLFCCCMCGLPGHTYNECLVFFEKPGVTDWYQSGVDYRTYAK